MKILTTLPTLTEGLQSLGIKSADTLLVHCALSKLGTVAGGSQTVIEALVQQLGKSGTIVTPTFNDGRFDPSEWRNPPLADHLWDRIRYETPLYDRNKTPTDHSMSIMYELFRRWPGVVRTTHPHSSMAAWGKHRDTITATHALDARFGETSPLARLYELNAKVLFLGTSFNTNTCFHLADYRQLNPPTREYMIVREVDGLKKLISYSDVDTDSSLFEEIGTDFQASSAAIETTLIGEAHCRVFSLRDAVNFAAAWLNAR